MKIYELLENPTAWIKNALARDLLGFQIFSEDPKATCWCLQGAMRKCYKTGSDEYYKVRGILEIAIHNIVKNYTGIASWQDHPDRTHVEIIALCKEHNL